MSLIFSGLSRLRNDDYDCEEQEISLPDEEDITYGIEQIFFRHTILTEEFPSLKLFNANQQFVLYNTKKYVIQNVSPFTPTIMFFLNRSILCKLGFVDVGWGFEHFLLESQN